MAESVFAKEDNIQVTAFDALSTDFALECGANIILRGLRTGIDFAAEFKLDWMNQRLAPELETLFMTPSDEVAGISSTLVKEVAKYGGDYEQFVPAVVAQALEDAFA
jgi:pantetheine-phosphate adenylyltransferase